jgi:hypothetical protein
VQSAQRLVAMRSESVLSLLARRIELPWLSAIPDFSIVPYLSPLIQFWISEKIA